MTIDEAIKILEQNLEGIGPRHRNQVHKSMQLGIEALKVVKETRRYNSIYSIKQLPGEDY